MFTKRHYDALAAIIRGFRCDNGASYDASTQEVSDFVRSPLAYTFAMALRRDNPSFDISTFVAACEPPKPIEPVRAGPGYCVNTHPAAREAPTVNEPWHGQGPRPAVPPFPIDEIGRMEGSRVIVTGKSFRLLAVGQAFRFMSENGVPLESGGKLAWQGARGPWVKVGARSYRANQDGFAHGPTHTVGTVNVLCMLEPPTEG